MFSSHFSPGFANLILETCQEGKDLNHGYNRAMSSIVAVDIETTGLNAQDDSIIEIGAVKFNGRRVEDTWTTLVNPRRPIPGFITQLTGISNNMVRQAPILTEVIGDLIGLPGMRHLGHNVTFDLTFCAKPAHCGTTLH